jgi:peptidoglycan/xylan/chitin deacetylase (PgdA/CDA1 family)
MLRQLFALMSPAGQRARLQVLIFHRVLRHADPLFPQEVDAARFDQICGWLRAWFNVVPLDKAVCGLRDGTLPERAAVITFDDGYGDNHDIALPILQRHGLTATFFIATGFLDGGRMWNDSIIEAIRRTALQTIDLRDLEGVSLGTHVMRGMDDKRAVIGVILPRVKHLPGLLRQSIADGIARRAAAHLPDDLMMTTDQVIALHRAGMQIGAHTVTHPILALLDAETARAEILASKQCLEHVLDAPVRLFAYPNGRPVEDYTAQTVAIARELGFDAAVTTAWGASDARTDRFEIPRFTPWDRTRMRFGGRLLRNLWS